MRGQEGEEMDRWRTDGKNGKTPDSESNRIRTRRRKTPANNGLLSTAPVARLRGRALSLEKKIKRLLT
jgi:hypothetical protein